MASRCVSGCFSLYIFLSLLFHLAELVMNAILAYCLWNSNDSEHKWFSLVTGIAIIPLVLIQLLSAILFLNRRGDSLSVCQSFVMAVLHVLHLGFVWRHVTILTERDVLKKKTDMAELFLLRMTYAFAAGFPLMLVHVFLIMEQSNLMWSWVLYAAAGASLLSTSWALASFQRQHETCDAEDVVLSWPGAVFKLLWRIGEVTCRVVSLALFASLYREWVFLVISLHWLTMLACVCTPAFSAVSQTNHNKVYTTSFRVLIAYMYVFSFINFSHANSLFRYVMFYVIVFLENGTLNVLWMLKTASQDTESRYLVVFISAVSFFVAIVSMTAYYKFFHISINHLPDEAKSSMCVQKSCINCKLSVCVKHTLKMQRPFSAGWNSQYNSAVYHGQYYKNLLQDSLLDDSCDSDVKSYKGEKIYKTMPDSHKGTHDKESDFEKQSVVSFQSAGTYVHRRYIDMAQGDNGYLVEDNTLKVPDLKDESLSDCTSVESGPPWLPSKTKSVSKTCLLTDTWDSLSDLDLNDNAKRRSVVSCRSLIRENTHNWYSDDYSTDGGTLEWSKLPVTMIGKNRSVVSDSESEYYCHCTAGLPHSSRNAKPMHSHRKPRMKNSHRADSGIDITGKQNSKNSKVGSQQGFGSLTESVKEKYENWHRKGYSSDLGKPCSNRNGKNITPYNQTHAISETILSDIALEINHTNQMKDNGGGNKLSSVWPTTNLDKIPPNNLVAQTFSNLSNMQRNGYCPKLPSSMPVMGSTGSSFRPVKKMKVSQSNSNVSSQFSDSNLCYKQSGDNSHNTPATVQSHSNGHREQPSVHSYSAKQGRRSRGSSEQTISTNIVYANVGYVNDDDDVFVDGPVVLSKETPWYVCSESEDSAFPQETFSSSHYEASDGESDDSLVLII